MHFTFDRQDLVLLAVSDTKPIPTAGRVILSVETEEAFRDSIRWAKLSTLELTLMYRNAGNIDGPMAVERSTAIAKLFELLAHGKPVASNTVTLWGPRDGKKQAATGRDRPVINTPVPARKAVPQAPRGNARPKIFEVADRMWSEAGSPKDVAVVLQLRKQIMAALESEHGIKRSTSSTALGDWQKVRLNS